MSELDDVSGATVRGANTKITYDVKELLAEIRDELKNINVSIAAKADKAQVDKLESRVDALERSGSQHAQRAETMARDAIRAYEGVVTDPAWASRTQNLAELSVLKESMAENKSAIANMRYRLAALIAGAALLLGGLDIFLRIVAGV